MCLGYSFEDIFNEKYHIQPNYHTVCLGFSKILGKLVVKYVPIYTKGTLKKKKQKKTGKDIK